MSTLRGRLFVIIAAAAGLLWLSAIAWAYVAGRREVEKMLDARLQEAAHMVDTIVAGGAPFSAIPTATRALEPANFQEQLSCQIWSLDGRFIGKSGGAPESRFADGAGGFSERVVDGETWRIYTINDAAKGVQVSVGDRISRREGLVRRMIEGFLTPTVVVAPLLALLVWISLGRGLRPLGALARELRGRDADDVRPVALPEAPSEVRPLVDSLNGLFVKLDRARRREREITAVAAHELRTPLAGLKTQAQVAMSSPDAAVKERALGQIVSAVDRASRLVRQLLAISGLDARGEREPPAPVDVGELLAEVVEATPVAGGSIATVIEPSVAGVWLRTHRELLALALRNLQENAVQYTPKGGTIRWSARCERGALRLRVEDEGPGIGEDELASVRQRFVRGRHRAATGSGLGLAIVDLALERCGGALSLTNRGDRGGLRAEIALERDTTLQPEGRGGRGS